MLKYKFLLFYFIRQTCVHLIKFQIYYFETIFGDFIFISDYFVRAEVFMMVKLMGMFLCYYKLMRDACCAHADS